MFGRFHKDNKNVLDCKNTYPSIYRALGRILLQAYEIHHTVFVSHQHHSLDHMVVKRIPVLSKVKKEKRTIRLKDLFS
jgi:hypothetical protein